MQKLGVSMYLYNLGVLNEEVFVQQPLNLVNSWGPLMYRGVNAPMNSAVLMFGGRIPSLCECFSHTDFV